MNTEIVEFNFNAIKLRGTLIDGEPYFCGIDVCNAIGIINNRNVISRLKDGVRTMDTIDRLGRTQKVTFISEPNLYKVALQSRKPEAEPFVNWVCKEVLPTIRRTGCYRAEREALTDEFKQVIKEICGESLRNAWLDILNSRDKERQQAVLNQIALMFDMTVQAQVRVECEKRISKMREVISLPVA